MSVDFKIMKKTLLLTLALLLSVTIFAQTKGTLLREFFDSAEMPEGWKITGGNNQNWSVSESNFSGGDAYEMKMEFEPYFANGFTKLTFPTLDLTGIDSVMVSFKHYVDIYTSYPSTIGIATSSSNGMRWNICYEESFVVDGQHDIIKVISNDDMNKNNVMMCIFFKGSSGNINAIYFDDIEVLTIEPNNAKLASVNIPRNIKSGNTDIVFTVQNTGTEKITSFEAEYKVDGQTFKQKFETELASLEKQQFTFEQGMYFKPGDYDLVVNITSVNDKEDDDHANDTLIKKIDVALGSTQKLPMIEHFSSSTCTYCVGVDNQMHTLIDNNANKFTYVKYPLDFPAPGDPYNTAECQVRKDYYIVNAAPRVVLDGFNLGSTAVSQYQLDNSYNKTAFVDIKGAFNIEGKTINITTDIMSYINLTNMKTFVVVNEKKTTGNVGTNGETEFYHVMMKMLDDANGNDTKVNSGEYQRFEFTYNMDTTNVEDMNDLEVAVWVQNLVSGEVFNSSFLYEYTDHPYPVRNLEVTEVDNNLQITWEAPEESKPIGYNVYVNNELAANNTKELSYSVVKESDLYVVEVVALYGDKKSVGIVKTSFVMDDEDNNEGNGNDTTNVISNYENRFKIYPNPVNDRLYIETQTLTQTLTIEIYDIYGRRQVAETPSHQGNVAIDVSNLKSGIYFVKVRTEEGDIVKRFMRN